jgi:DNA-binding response OmpR family regulator
VEKQTILVVDDDKAIADSTAIYLKNEGYDVLTAKDGMDALEMLENHSVHLVILDIMMPRMDGIAATLKIREQRNIPIIMLTAKSEDADKVMGLGVGADDYVTKPFSPLELIARVKSALRRYTHLGGSTAEEKEGKIVIGGLEFDFLNRRVTVDGVEVHLTPLEYRILLLLCKNPDRIFTAAEIYQKAWKDDVFVSDNTIAVHIRRVREKIEINPKKPKYLKVVWGIGYKIESGEPPRAIKGN